MLTPYHGECMPGIAESPVEGTLRVEAARRHGHALSRGLAHPSLLRNRCTAHLGETSLSQRLQFGAGKLPRCRTRQSADQFHLKSPFVTARQRLAARPLVPPPLEPL